MKKTGIWLAALCVCALVLSVVAVHATPQAPANVAGTWTITMAPPAGGGGGNGGGGGGGRRGGGGPQTWTFKQDGAKISGSLPGRNGGADTPFEGTVSGNDVTWTVTRSFNGNDVTQTYKATVDGDNMKGTVTSSMGNGTPRDFTATRSK